MKPNEFNNFLQQHDVADTTADQLSGDLDRLAEESGLGAEILGGIVILTTQLIEASNINRSFLPRSAIFMAEPDNTPPTTLADERLVVVHSDRHIVLDGKIKYLEAQPFNILSLLAKHADQIVHKDDVVETVWGVKPSAITDPHRQKTVRERAYNGVKRLRDGLGPKDLGHALQGVIQTHYAKGWSARTSLNE